MAKFRVIVTDDRYGDYTKEKEVLAEIDAELMVYNLKEPVEAVEKLALADGILVNLFPLSNVIIENLEKCQVISRYGVGFDNVDIDAATKKGIRVCRVPDYSFEDVSDHALALLLGSVRKIAYKDRMIREGKWNLHNTYPCLRIRGKILGIVGYGMIGKTFHRKVAGFGLDRVLIYDPYADTKDIESNGGISMDLDTLVAESDFISIHAPCNDQTRHMFNDVTFSAMRKNTILINTSRGGLIDEKSLCRALDNGTVSAAGLDVFETEPLPVDSRLRKYDSVILSDHTGFYSEESLTELKTKAARNIVEVLTGETPTYMVN